MPPALVFFINITLGIQGLFWFHTDFRIVCSSSVKNASVILIEITIFIFERPRQSVSGEGQREKETQNPMQALGSELSAQSPTQGSNS